MSSPTPESESSMNYFPPPHPAPWTTATPAEAGLDPEALAAAARHAGECETPWLRDLALMVTSDFQERPPWNETLGPMRPRGGPNGLVLRGGRIAAEWGETTRADMTFSVAKSYLAVLAGLAWDRGLIRDPHDEVRRTVEDGGFDPPHNDSITWHHLLQQTSEWEGVLWGKPDLVDRNRSSAGRPSAARKGTHRDLHPPGGFWEYNDVRVKPSEPRSPAVVAPPAARGVSRTGHGPDRRHAGLAMGRLSQLLDRDRRQAGAIRLGRRSLGRRRLHLCARPGANRSDAARPRD